MDGALVRDLQEPRPLLVGERSDELHVPVDLVEKETLKPGLGEQILREAEPV